MFGAKTQSVPSKHYIKRKDLGHKTITFYVLYNALMVRFSAMAMLTPFETRPFQSSIQSLIILICLYYGKSQTKARRLFQEKSSALSIVVNAP
jgi:hypothetical protein